jgi:hypothetical protein
MCMQVRDDLASRTRDLQAGQAKMMAHAAAVEQYAEQVHTIIY